MRTFTSYVSAYDSHVGSVPMDEMSRNQQDELIRAIFNGEFEEYVMDHDIDHAYPNALWTLVVAAGMDLERSGVIKDFENRTPDDRDWIINFFAPSKLWLRLEEAFPPFDDAYPKTEYLWGELEQFAKRDMIAELEGMDWRRRLRNPADPSSGILQRLPYQTFVKEYDSGKLSFFVDRGLAVQAFRLSDSAWTYILPLVFFAGLLAFIPVAIFWSIWGGIVLLTLAIVARKSLTANAVAWVRKDALASRRRFRWLSARGVIWARRV